MYTLNAMFADAPSPPSPSTIDSAEIMPKGGGGNSKIRVVEKERVLVVITVHYSPFANILLFLKAL